MLSRPPTSSLPSFKLYHYLVINTSVWREAKCPTKWNSNRSILLLVSSSRKRKWKKEALLTKLRRRSWRRYENLFYLNIFVLHNIYQTYLDIFHHLLCQTLENDYWTVILHFFITKKNIVVFQIWSDQVFQEVKD